VIGISRQGLSRIAMRSAAARGLTLLEVVISIAVIGLILGSLLTFLWQTLEIRNRTRLLAERTQIAHGVLDRMAAEIRGCLGGERIGFPVEPRLIGDRRSISLLTTATPSKDYYRFFRESDELPPGSHDIRQIGYRLWVDPQEETEDGQPLVGGLIRTEKQTLNQFVVDEQNPEQLRQDVWAPEIGYIEFRYFDGVEWDVKWEVTQENSLPQLVMITIGFESMTKDEYEDADLDVYPVDQYPLGDELPNDERYSLIVRVPAADKFFGSRMQRVGQQLSDQLGVEGVR
jgi:prepilin-type N-terminal cleavage/methylation domain-containing protein